MRADKPLHLFLDKDILSSLPYILKLLCSSRPQMLDLLCYKLAMKYQHRHVVYVRFHKREYI